MNTKSFYLFAWLMLISSSMQSMNNKRNDDPYKVSRQRLERTQVHAYNDYVRYRRWMGRITIVNALFTATSLCCLARAHSVVQKAQTQQLSDSIFCPQRPSRQTKQSSDQP